MTTEATIADLLMRRLSTLPTQSPPVSFAWPGIKFSPATLERYLIGNVLPVDNVNNGIADDSTTEHSGIFQITVVTPASIGIIEATELAGAVADHFERDTVLRDGSVTVRVMARPSIGSYLQEGDRLRVPVRVRYYALV